MQYTQAGRVTDAHLAQLEEAAARHPKPWTMGVGSYVMKALIEELRELRELRERVAAVETVLAEQAFFIPSEYAEDALVYAEQVQTALRGTTAVRSGEEAVAAWAEHCVEATGVVGGEGDGFTIGDALTLFSVWVSVNNAPAWEGSRAALRDEMQRQVTALGLEWDGYRKRFTGGRLR